jgi:NADP-dependent 3-hydroxy acid dehydrogenase YdfG
MTHSLLIGGTKGFGHVVAMQFSQRGDSVSVFGRSEIPINGQSAGIFDSYKLDINDPFAVSKGVEEIIAKRGHLNHCVFLQRFRGKRDDWAGEIQTTMTSTKSIVEIIVPQMASEGDNAFVMVREN